MIGRALTRETPAPGLVIWQPARGFRYALEPFLLCGWALEGGWPRTAGDLGTGCGVAALLLARLGVRCSGWDVSEDWIRLARRSAEDSVLNVAFDVRDVRTLPLADLDLALCNPPYLPAGRGPGSPDPWRDAARTERHGTLDELAAAAVRTGRRACLVVPRSRAREAEHALERADAPVRRRCEVDSSLVLLEGRRHDPGPVAAEIAATRTREGWSPRVRAWYALLGARLSDRPGHQCTSGEGPGVTSGGSTVRRNPK
ncbi:MAG: methyltransferase domain-containing protein [Deltaproteobacteria bacterium]|nr:methyltransferase domain-containing protein [Deltaproteobacteria bacterium]